MTNKSGFPLCLHINTGIEKLHSRVFARSGVHSAASSGITPQCCERAGWQSTRSVS